MASVPPVPRRGDTALSRCQLMRRLLTATAAASVLLGGPAMAQVDPKVHKLCIEAKDYAGCVTSNAKNISIRERRDVYTWLRPDTKELITLLDKDVVAVGDLTKKPYRGFLRGNYTGGIPNELVDYLGFGYDVKGQKPDLGRWIEWKYSVKTDGEKSEGQFNIAIGDCLEKRVDWIYDGNPCCTGIDSISQNDFDPHRYKYWWAQEAQEVMNTYCPLMDSLVRTELDKEASILK